MYNNDNDIYIIVTKEIKLTQGKVAIVDDEDYDYLINFKWCAKKTQSGIYFAVHSFFNYNDKTQETFYMHRLVMDALKGDVVDHINHNTLDNRRCNLRICTHLQNSRNQLIPCNNTTGYKGVYYSSKRNKFITLIKIDNKRLRVGEFKTKEESAIAYNMAASFHFGEFAHLNDVPSNFVLSNDVKCMIENRIKNFNEYSIPMNNTSGYKGVCYDKRAKKWKSYIYTSKTKKIHLGYFKSKIEAALAYDEVSTFYHAEKAYKNFPMYV